MTRVGIIAGLATISCAASIHAQQTICDMQPGAEAWYLPTRDGSGELFVYEIGQGDELVIVLHGGPGGDFRYMLPIASGLEQEYRFVFYDQRGSLRSRAIIDSISMPKHVEDLETLRSALGQERVSIISHSAGTLLAFEYLTAYPERVQNLVLVGALPHKNGRQYFDEEYAEWWSTLGDDMRRFEERSAVQAELEKVREGASTLTAKQEAQLALIRQVGAGMYHVERWREQVPNRVNPLAAAATRETTEFEYDYGDQLASHPFPVTVINGEFDYVVGPRGSPLWKRLKATRAPELEVVVIPDAGHKVWSDAPNRFRSALRKALSARQ